MKQDEATKVAQELANKHDFAFIVVDEGPHRDEFEEDDPSFGYCPESARATLYKHGKVVATLKPDGKPA